MIRERLDGIDGLICDLDGVLYRGDRPIEGAPEAVARLRERGIRVVFCTNNSRSTIDQYLEKLATLGIDVDRDEVITSAIVTAGVLKERGFSGKTAIVVGGEGIREALSDVCISVKDDPHVIKADLVVVGWDQTFTYDAMKRAAAAVSEGATFIATNDDASFPAPEGLWPGAGAILASIETAASKKAEVMGKPHPPMLDAAARRLEGCKGIAIVGDTTDTDLAGAPERGWKTILVLSGVTTADAARSLSPAPDLVIESVAELG